MSKVTYGTVACAIAAIAIGAVGYFAYNSGKGNAMREADLMATADVTRAFVNGVRAGACSVSDRACHDDEFTIFAVTEGGREEYRVMGRVVVSDLSETPVTLPDRCTGFTVLDPNRYPTGTIQESTPFNPNHCRIGGLPSGDPDYVPMG